MGYFIATMSVFPATVPDWNNLQVIHRNTLPPRPHFFVYDDERSALSRDTKVARTKCLSGTWKFNLSKTPLEGPSHFYAQDFDASGFDDVKVPGMWQCQGYGEGPHYANIQYPQRVRKICDQLPCHRGICQGRSAPTAL